MIKETKIISHAKYHIPGGIHPKEFKSISNQNAIEWLPQANELIIPVPNNLTDKQFLVSVGDSVVAGQSLLSLDDDLFSLQIHAPCAGVVLAITHKNIGHPSGLPMLSVIIKTELSRNVSSEKTSSLVSPDGWMNLQVEELIQKIHDSGIVGMGGAAFPTHIKLNTSVNRVTTLIVNAMECEPYITCDDRLLRGHSTEVLQGALITAKIVGAKNILFGIEDNKPQAITCLENAITQYKNTPGENHLTLEIRIIIAKTKYPSGGEKQLIQLLTGLEVPKNKYPADLDIIVQNVATLYAINDTICHGKTLTHRLVTITGDLVKKPGNYWIAFGTPLSHIVSTLEIVSQQVSDIILGGPLMGQIVSDVNIPTQKSTNCIIFNADIFSAKNIRNESKTVHTECIRCGECETACPVSLLPQQLYWFSKSEQWEALEEQNLFDCIECGACSYVCPSEIPLVNYYRYAKSEIKYLKVKQQQSENAKIRFENREKRLARIKTEREEKRQKTAEARKSATNKLDQDPDGKKSAIEAALKRVKDKKEKQS